MRCAFAPMHGDVPASARPEARYFVHLNPCEVSSCAGRLLCIGHPACVTCAAAIRADKTKWSVSGNELAASDIYLLTNEPAR